MRALGLSFACFALACGGGVQEPSPLPTPPAAVGFPEWRMDRGDALNYLLGHQAPDSWNWAGSGGAGHGIAVVHEGDQHRGRVVFVKLQDVNYEVLDYDEAWIYHREDHAGRWNGGAKWMLAEPHAAYSWRNDDGGKTVWMPRRVTPGFYWANVAHKHYYGLGSCEVDRTYRSNLYAHVVGIEMVDMGGHIGNTEVLHYFFEHPKKDRSFDSSEHYWYSWELGWVRWKDARWDWTFYAPRSGPIPQYEPPCVGDRFQ